MPKPMHRGTFGVGGVRLTSRAAANFGPLDLVADLKRQASASIFDVKRKTPSEPRTGHRIKADLHKQTPNNSHSRPLYYEDLRFTCRDCGAECVWTAEQQRLWYEQWGGPVQSTAIRCRACRKRVQRAKIEQKKHMLEMARRAGKR